MKLNKTSFTIAFFVLLLTHTVFGQKITGIVYDDNKTPLPGASVYVKGTPKGTATDFDGKYEIEIDAKHHILVFSFVGFKTKEVNAKGKTVINVTLEQDSAALEEVVVVGMAKMERKSAVGAVAHFVIPNNESYATVKENDFKDVTKNPLSTFSVDVDKASYSNVRRHINNGNLPPTDAVRIEEMINYFNYDYQQPKGDVPFSINTELSTCPWNKTNLLLHVGLQGKDIPMEDLPPSNIVFLLDVSGSMNSPNKLPLLKSSLKLLLENLRPEDRVAIVVYAGNSGLVLPSTSCSEKKTIIDALESLSAGGSTAGGAGLKLAYKVANENFLKKGNNRIIMATDGDFNVGLSSNSEMEQLITSEREKGIAISVLGFGMGNYKDDKMEIIADKGNGNYAYIDNLLEARKVLVSEFGGTLYTIAKDVKFQLEFNPAHVSKYRLVGYENRLLNDEDFEDDTKDAGEIGAGHTVTALYEIIPSKNDEKNDRGLKYQTSELTNQALESNDLITLKLRYKKPDKNKSLLIEQCVKKTPVAINQTSDNFMFSASVAEFGMLLRNSKYLGTTTWESAYNLAKESKGNDEEGYRGELIRLIKSAELLNTTVQE
ncbi:vWA domain-containing protein [Aestuariibaculum lutulentum]|uniref:von Willebrand factor type A domain-containing protein n=1 Tax=Aestuariibaculum lutulentum TaxID=2920935 RepID=A0ABS9RLF6_9FLAO|nr:von Willebrand factor type A domain-containing protein [Aestuariibaculum lutulentum]MCH4553771.1 von Willebrand factor type A domain-containing protein [Aestuariibaculum lutulentum]